MGLELEDGKYHTFLATIDEDGKPHIYPIAMVVISQKIYFITRNNSSKTKQISMNPSVEILKPSKKRGDISYLKIEGEVFRIFEESIIENIVSEFQFPMKDQRNSNKSEQFLTFELLPTVVEQVEFNEIVMGNSKDVT